MEATSTLKTGLAALRAKVAVSLCVPLLGVAGAGGLALFAFALRLFRLESKDIWWDEGWSVWLARQDLGSIATITASDEHPPLHYWFLHFWNGWAGEGEFAVRFTSVLFAVATVALTYRLGRELWGRPWGLVAALLLATSRFHIGWSQEIKMYSPAIFLALVAIFFFLRLLREPRARFWVGYVVVNLAGLYLFYLHIFVLVVINLVFVVLWWRREVERSWWLGWVKAQGVIVLGFLPWLVYFLSRARTWERLPPLDLGQFITVYLLSMPLGLLSQVNRELPMALPFAVLALLGMGVGWWAWRKQRAPFGLVTMAALVGFPFLLYLTSLPPSMPYHPKLAARYFILFLPIYVLVLVQGMKFLAGRRRFLGVAALAVTLALGGEVLVGQSGYYQSRYATYDLSNLAAFVRAYALGGDALVMNSAHDWPLLAYYNVDNLPLYRIPRTPKLTAQEVDRILAPAPSRDKSLWVVTTKDALPQATELVAEWLRTGYSPVTERQYGSNTLTLWSQGSDAHGLAQRLPLELNDGSLSGALSGVRLLGFEPLPEGLRTNDTMYLASYWQATADQTPEAFQARLVLRDERGRPVLSESAGCLSPLHVNGQWRRGQVIRSEQRFRGAALPAGRFRVELEVEDTATHRRLTVEAGSVTVEAAAETSSIVPQGDPSLRRLGVSWEDKIWLLGYQLPETTFKPVSLPLTLFWRAQAGLEGDYRVVIQLVDEKGTVRVNLKDDPLVWASIQDGANESPGMVRRYQVPLWQEMAPGEYAVMVGLFDEDAEDFLVPAGRDEGAMVEIARVKVAE